MALAIEHDVELAPHPRQGSPCRQGRKGERGHRSEKGDAGPAAAQPLICGWKIHAHNFRAVPFGADGRPLPELDLNEMFRFCVSLAINAAKDEMEQALTKIARGW